MTRILADSRRWMLQGTGLVAAALEGLDDRALSATTDLPGWTRRHLVAHLSANADALGNLVHWATTGDVTPMYTSMEQRNADIEAGSAMPGDQLIDWFARSAAALDESMNGLTAEQWAAAVVTAQGRTVPASETPWMRAREVMVHAVDLAAGVSFSDLPVDFLAALCDEIVAKRSTADGPALILLADASPMRWEVGGTGHPMEVSGPLPAIAEYLTGRGAEGVAGADGGPVPDVGAWL